MKIARPGVIVEADIVEPVVTVTKRIGSGEARSIDQNAGGAGMRDQDVKIPVRATRRKARDVERDVDVGNAAVNGGEMRHADHARAIAIRHQRQVVDVKRQIQGERRGAGGEQCQARESQAIALEPGAAPKLRGRHGWAEGSGVDGAIEARGPHVGCVETAVSDRGPTRTLPSVNHLGVIKTR